MFGPACDPRHHRKGVRVYVSAFAGQDSIEVSQQIKENNDILTMTTTPCICADTLFMIAACSSYLEAAVKGRTMRSGWDSQ
jgi:hypothetical protein